MTFDCNNRIRRVGRNPRGGRDLIVGDIHGMFDALHGALVAVGFGDDDRLFSVGDLVDRGPDSHQAFVWLRQPWFYAVRGNHEEAAIAYTAGHLPESRYRDGYSAGWFVALSTAERDACAAAFAAMPVALELETERGLVGIVHAGCPHVDWARLRAELDAGGLQASVRVRECLESRHQWLGFEHGPVAGVRAVVVGHQPVERVTSLDNTIYIDTQPWRAGHFTLLDAATLEPARSPSAGLRW